MTQKLSSTADIRTRLLQLQGGVCPVCNKRLLPSDAVLDHDHTTGKVRAVLHRNCNQLEAKLRGLLRRFNVQDITYEQLLANLMELWTGDHHWFVHPDHMTEYKRQAKAVRKRLQSLKTAKAVPKYQQELKLLREKHRAYMSTHCITEDTLNGYSK